MRQGFVFSIIVLTIFCAPVFGLNGDMGRSTQLLTDGSEEYPWLIEDYADFRNYTHNYSWHRGEHARLECDLDLSLAGHSNWDSIGSQNHPFEGTFDGNGHVISNLDRWLFNYIGHISRDGGIVNNLFLENVNIIHSTNLTSYHGVGSLCRDNKGTIINCHSAGTVSSTAKLWDHSYTGIGGLCGINGGTIQNCSFTGMVTGLGFDDVGGVCGLNHNTIRDSHSSAVISGQRDVGGLCGGNGGYILMCSSRGEVTGTVGIGGLFGVASETGFYYIGIGIKNSFSTCIVSGERYIGGLAGAFTGFISNCYATGTVTGEQYVGGLFGLGGGAIPRFRPLVINSYSTGSVIGNEFVGGLYVLSESGGGVFPEDVINFWDIETSGIGTADERYFNAIGKLTADMKTKRTFTDAGWDFIGETANGAEDIWGIHEGSDYPRLWWEFTNASPIANAGGDITAYAFAGGDAEVQLNGTGSKDADGDPLEYYWYNDANELIATGAEPNFLFGIGEYEITLIVNDGIEDSEANSVFITVLQGNTSPVADAGGDQVVYASLDGYALVQLDGTGSTDADGDVLEYFWYDANELIATGAEPNVLFGIGEYEVTLIVNDGIEDSQPDSCVITVVDPFEALTSAVSEWVHHKGIANSLTAKLDAARKKLEDGNEKNDKAAVHSLNAFIHAVNAQRGKKISEADADSLIMVAEQIINML